jgi:hypothetical protein
VAGGHRPAQERLQASPLVVVVGGVPGVQVGLGHLSQQMTALLEPAQEPVGLGELVAGELAVAGVRGRVRGLGPQPWQLVPDSELLQQPQVRTVGEFGQTPVQPGLVVQQLLVDGGQHAAGHQQVAQVGGGPPTRHRVQPLMGQGDASGGQISKQLGNLGVLEPDQAGAGLVHGRERLQQRRQRGVDAAAAVVQGGGELAGEGAPRTPPAGRRPPLAAAVSARQAARRGGGRSPWPQPGAAGPQLDGQPGRGHGVAGAGPAGAGVGGAGGDQLGRGAL